MPSMNDSGKTYWRSLEELAETPEFRQRAEREFSADFLRMLDGVPRRRFLQLMGASIALAGAATGCRRWPERKLAPESQRPEGTAPGERQHYATAMELGGVARPLVVTSYDGRPIKVEGNPLHPASRGAAGALAQAAVLEMYDPERSQTIVHRVRGKAEPCDRQRLYAFLDEHFRLLRQQKGYGLSILSEATSSPSVAMLRAELARVMPKARWYTCEPIHRDHEIAGAKLAFGQPVRTHLHLDKAKIIAAFDADLFMRHPDALALSADWAKGRRSADQDGSMNRMYVAESQFSVTGTCADHRAAVRSSAIPEMLSRLARRLEAGGSGVAGEDAFLNRLAADLLAHRGASIVVTGPGQPAEVHALVHKINAELGNVGATVSYTEEPDGDRPSGAESIAQLVSAANSGLVDTLLILGGNPVYDAPADAGFAEALGRIKTSLHLSLYDNETSHRSVWHVPRAHWLESWGDARSYDGTVSVVQPLMTPLFDGVSVLEVLGRLVEFKASNPSPLPTFAQGERGDEKSPLDAGLGIVKETLRGILKTGDFEHQWRQILHDGLVAGTGYRPVTPKLKQDLPAMAAAPAKDSLELVFLSDYRVYDGRFANNGWLQELPDPMTKITWDNAAVISPATARRLGLASGDVVALSAGGKSQDVAVYVMPGVADGTIAVSLGYGRTAAGHVGNGVGFDAYALRTSQAMDHVVGVALARTGRTYSFAVTSDHSAVERSVLRDRYHKEIEELVREGTLAEYRAEQDFARQTGQEGKSSESSAQLWEQPIDYDKAASHQWGMAIDLNSCIGCGACVVACQAENNIPIVGKQEVANGREMHWIRVDRYFQGDPEKPTVAHQPVACHHCENAPCEQVCPVGATVHDSEGLNVMVYNRCVGTRYCSNNCPYKVRRFNFLDWQVNDPRREGRPAPYLGIPDTQDNAQVDAVKRMVHNPDVTVRMRGVMEKCTYCVQRIKAAERAARLELDQGQRPDASVRDGEVVPACAQTCPTQAIVFGNLKDPTGRVAQIQRENHRAYAMLAELNVRPRTMYLARLRNPAEEA